jgi:hypothetical protein
MSNDLTFDAWVYPTGPGSSSSWGGIIVNREGEYEIGRSPNGMVWWAFANSNPGWTSVNTGYVLPLNEWTHIAVTYDRGAIRTYANGSLVHSYSGQGAIGEDNTSQNEVRLGGRQWTAEFFQGLIDESSLYNRALSSDEILSIFQAGAAGKGTTPDNPPPSGLVGWWPAEGTANDFLSNSRFNIDYSKPGEVALVTVPVQVPDLQVSDVTGLNQLDSPAATSIYPGL